MVRFGADGSDIVAASWPPIGRALCVLHSERTEFKFLPQLDYGRNLN
jgi:hypothetical protein